MHNIQVLNEDTKMKNYLSLFFLMIFSVGAIGSEALETDSFRTIEKKVLAQGKKYGIKNVLAVFDIDNTVLAMAQNFGSDQWFGWQYDNCIGKKQTPDFCISNDFSKLLDVQGQIFALSNMHPTEQATVSVIKNLQKKGFKVILLTSRGPDFRNSTEKALANNGLRFVRSAIGPKKGYAGTYTPYSLKNFKNFGLTKNDLQKMGNKPPRPVSYMNGIFMTSGLNKGIMLKTLLAKTNSNFKAIIFADDHLRHTKRMQSIMGAVKGVDVTTYRYSKIDSEVKAFKASDKKEVISAWSKHKAMTDEIYK